MLAALLPGLREIRAPLAAGYGWLAFAYLVAGSPSDPATEMGPLAGLAEQVAALGPVAAGGVVSFVAYLLGSVSGDLFGIVVPSGIGRMAKVLSRLGEVSPGPLGLLYALRSQARDAGQATGGPDGVPAQTVNELTGYARYVRSLVRELELAGASGEERPESTRAMMYAEEQLRVAILPPALATAVYLSLQASPAWLLGLVFAAALFVQAAMRQVAVRRLAGQAYQATRIAVLSSEIDDAIAELSNGDVRRGLAILGALDVSSLDR